ncbi:MULTISPECIES: hypothetical protein [Weissella]|uniref:Uncharacterized protein n=1 Tax=Weissella thailandensis TaxID=89061 RepID=A0ABX9I6F1_9LACO|nr:hypothetical protein [Weissella thailandensis]NKY90238.1 hypothetical protein [Weissella thailandensis]RDS60313.1 hypothetical protein DWV05_01835 [Weissella thailandensis]GEP74026.1 hypothetical protein WTH01_02730 [Weissella thailandensis]
MSQNTTDLSLSIFSWRGDRPTPVPFPEHDESYSDVDLSTKEVDDLIFHLIVAQARDEQITIRLANDEFQGFKLG